MNEYVIGVFAICLVGGALMKLSYGSRDGSGLAIAVITVYVIAAPAAGALKNADFDSILGQIEISDAEYGSEYEAYARDAFEKGICIAVANEFSLDTDSVFALASGFDAEKMRADGIKVVISGSAVTADYKLIEEYVNNLDIGECSVEIKIG